MQYMLMCCSDEERWARVPEAQKGTIMQEYDEFLQAIRESGHLRASVKFRPSSTSTTVRETTKGKTVITDGPFAETKEQLEHHVVECQDLDEAISIALRIPTLRVGGSIDVRPVESVFDDVRRAESMR